GHLDDGRLVLRGATAGGGLVEAGARLGEPLSGQARQAARLVATAGAVQRAGVVELVVDVRDADLVEHRLAALAIEAVLGDLPVLLDRRAELVGIRGL